MATGKQKRAVGVFSSSQQAEQALNELRHSGFPMHQVSIVARDTAEQNKNIAGVDVKNSTENQTGKAATVGAIAGGTVGGIVGLIGALSALAIPGIGPVVAGGAVASILGDALIGGAVGAATGGITGALMGLGVPEERAKIYHSRVSQGDYLVLVEGTEAEITTAETVLSVRGIQEWGIFDGIGFGVDPVGVDYVASYEPEPEISSSYATHLSSTLMAPTLDPTYAGYAPVHPMGLETPNIALEQQRRAVGVFSSRQDAEKALSELRDSGFPMQKVSVVARDSNQTSEIAGVGVGDHLNDSKTADDAKTGAVAGGALGGLTGLLVGVSALAIPGVGPLALAGVTATAIATTLSGGAIGAVAGTIIGGLTSLGIPEEQAKVYNDRVSGGGYLVMVDGTPDEISTAESVLSLRGIQEWRIFNAPDGNASPSNSRNNSGVIQDNVTHVNEQVTIIDRRQ